MAGRTRKARQKHYRCIACSAPTPVGYLRCGNCGHDHSKRFIVVNTLDELQHQFADALKEIQATPPRRMDDA